MKFTSKVCELFSKLIAIFKMPPALFEERNLKEVTEPADYATVMVKLNKHFDNIFNT